jgi:hypothetical protein
MNEDRSTERTETDERVAENQSPAPIASLTREPDGDIDPATGLPRGQHDNDASPLDPGEPLDPFRGKGPPGGGP